MDCVILKIPYISHRSTKSVSRKKTVSLPTVVSTNNYVYEKSFIKSNLPNRMYNLKDSFFLKKRCLIKEILKKQNKSKGKKRGFIWFKER